MADGAFFIWSESGQKEKQRRERGREEKKKKKRAARTGKESVSKQQVSAAAKISCETGSERCQSGNVVRRPALADLTGLHRSCRPA